MFQLGDAELNSNILYKQTRDGALDVELTETARARVEKFRDLVNNALNSGETFYGLNTGFGYLSNVRIEEEKLDLLQVNLVRSHACGTGEYVDKEISRALLLLRVHTFALEKSEDATKILTVAPQPPRLQISSSQ